MRTADTVPPASPPTDLSALRRHFEISLYFLLLIGVLTLISTGKLDLPSILLPPVALLVKGYRWWRGRGPELSHRIATLLTGGYFIFLPVDLWVVSRMLSAGAQNQGLYAALLATIHLMLFAIIVRLYSASSLRDYLFLSLMAFTSMLAAAVLTVDSFFFVFFFMFLALAVSTFVGLEMWRSAQGAVAQPLASGSHAAHRLHNALGITSAAIAFGAVVVGALIFLFLPRVYAGYLSGFNLQPTLISGFSDNVELGEIGEIKKSGALVMRIRVEGGLDAARGVHWRGIALTKFDGKRWYNDPHGPVTITAGADGWFHFTSGAPPQRMPGATIRYSVLLEPVATTSLFLANAPVSVRGGFMGEPGAAPLGPRQAYLLEDAEGSIFNPYHNFSRMQYEARSLLPHPSPAALREAGSNYSADIREVYLQLPPLDQRIPKLAAEITARAQAPYDKAVAIEGYLRSHYGYTLDLTGPPPKDPLAYFLFTKRAGHCEYFATAMTVLLRSVGIPARYINGFQTGEFNDVGGDFIVRASDAHSWVEVFFPSNGWLTFDPTPPSNDGPPGLFAQLGQYWDWLELQWSEWVINYDFIHQFTLAQSMRHASRDWVRQFRRWFETTRRAATYRLESLQTRLNRSTSTHPGALAVLGVLCMAALLLHPKIRRRLLALWQLRVTGSTTMTPHLATLQYSEMLRLLARRGMRKAPGQTAVEFAASVPDGNLIAPVQEMTEIYHTARFGGRPADPRRASSLLERIRSIVRHR
jgi:protein-glutamine gamma-glutamyltransferase